MSLGRLVASSALLCAFAFGQSVEERLRFEVASVKPAVPPKPDAQGRIFAPLPTGGPGTKDPGRIHFPNMGLRALILRAYDVKTFQLTGPAWLDDQRFDITATMPPETTKGQFEAMLRSLLADRFGLVIHRDTRELPMYSLVVAKGGPKLKESVDVPAADDSADPPAPPVINGPLKRDAEGFPIIPVARGGRGPVLLMMNGRARMMGQHVTLHELAERLASQLNRPVTDETGLNAKYDFTLTYAPDAASNPIGPVITGARIPAAAPPEDAAPPSADAPLPNLFAAIQQQLGLRLEPKKGPVEMLVVDHMEKVPTEN